MSATVCPVNPPGHDWENGLTCRWCWDTRTVAEAILSQLSSRRGGDPASAQSLLDAYQAEVLAEDGQAYPGELAMLHGLIATLTAVAEHGDLKDVRKLLEEHKHDDAAARAGTPRPEVAADSTRQGALLAVIRGYGEGGRWKSGIARQALAALGYDVAKGTAGTDLAQLAAEGHLVRHDEKGVTFYLLAQREVRRG